MKSGSLVITQNLLKWFELKVNAYFYVQDTAITKELSDFKFASLVQNFLRKKKFKRNDMNNSTNLLTQGNEEMELLFTLKVPFYIVVSIVVFASIIASII